MADYTAKVNFNVKVLDFVQYGGPGRRYRGRPTPGALQAVGDGT